MGGGGKQQYTDMYVKEKSLKCYRKNWHGTQKYDSVQQEAVRG